MSKTTIQVDYEALKKISTTFEQQVDASLEIKQRLGNQIDILRGGGWVGVGANVFYSEMDTDLIPALDRLSDSLSKAVEDIQRVSMIYLDAENEAADLLNLAGVRSTDTSHSGESYVKATLPFTAERLEDGSLYDQNGYLVTEPVSKIYVPGILTTPQGFEKALSHLGPHGYVGLYNESSQFRDDISQALNDRAEAMWGIRVDPQNPAVTSLKEQLIDGIHSDRPLEIVAHSQGGAITSAALSQLVREGYTAEQLSNIRVITYGSAGTQFPEGPRYTHFVIAGDAVPTLATASDYIKDSVVEHLKGPFGMGPLEVFKRQEYINNVIWLPQGSEGGYFDRTHDSELYYDWTKNIFERY